MHILSTPIEYLKGVGPIRAELLKSELNIFTYQDLITHYPFRYIDRSKIYKIGIAFKEQITDELIDVDIFDIRSM